MGGSVKIRQLEDGSYVLSPNPKRRRTDIDEEEGSKGAEISADPPGGEDKINTEDPKGKKVSIKILNYILIVYSLRRMCKKKMKLW